MASKDDYRQAARKLKEQLDKTHSAFKTIQLAEIGAALNLHAGAGGQIKGATGAAEMETALLDEGLLVFPPLGSATDGYVRLYRSGTVIATILNAIRYPGSGSDEDLANLISKVKTPKALSVSTPSAPAK